MRVAMSIFPELRVFLLLNEAGSKTGRVEELLIHRQ